MHQSVGISAGIVRAATFLVAVSFASSVMAQGRLSLAERVARLEQDAQGNQANIGLVNQLQALQTEVQQLRGQVEELRHQLDEARERSKQQYIDLDSRLGRLEGRAAGAPSGANDGQLQDIQLRTPGDATDGLTPADASTNTIEAGTAESNHVESLGGRGDGVAPSLPSARPTVDPAAEKTSYDDAFGALKDGRYAESARRFQAFIEQYPSSELISNAYYWLGESYYVTQNYRISLDTFQKLLGQYPDSPKAPDALLKTGYCQYELKQWNAAETTFNDVMRKYPDTTVARLAQGRLRALRLESRR